MDQVLIFYGMSVVTAMLGMIIAALAISYHKLAKRHNKLHEELTRIDADVKAKYEQIIINAQAQASEIITDASKKSQSLVSASDIFAKEYKQEFRAKLLQILDKEAAEFQKMYEAVKSESAKVIGSVSKDIEKTLSAEMLQVRKIMQTQMQQGLAEYKKAAYARLEEEVAAVVELVAKDVLKKSLNKEEQKRLVMDALNEAKQNNVL